STKSNQLLLWQFVLVFGALAAFAIFRIFRSGYGVLDAVMVIGNSQGDTTALVEKRLELFDTGSTVAFGILYSSLPALAHVALFKAKEAGKAWRLPALLAVLVTAGLLLA